jgi:hypothetical protein
MAHVRDMEDDARREAEKAKRMLIILRHRYDTRPGTEGRVAEHYTNVPVRVITDAAKRGLCRPLLSLITLKLTKGFRVAKKDAPHWKAMLKAGWVRECRGFIYPLPWAAIGGEEIAEGPAKGRMGATTVKYDLRLVAGGLAGLFFTVQEYMRNIHAPTLDQSLRMQEGRLKPRRKAGGKATRPRRQPKATLRHSQSVHKGGVSLSLLADAFDRTKAWASQMRRRCETELLCGYRRRFEQVSADEVRVANALGMGGAYRYDAAHGHWAKEIVAEALPSLFLDFTWRVW